MLVKSKVKYIQSLSQKKFRDEEGVFVAEGPKIINELLAGGRAVPVEIFALQSWFDGHATLVARHPDIMVIPVSESELERISFLSTPNEVLGVFKKPVFEQTKTSGLILLLDNLQDPGNLGTIIRCADWFGVNRIVCNPGSADHFNPKVVQSSMASIVRVEV
ncbi:MAG: RNA methyltransferase, partial [Chitinophagaceae bacterium]